MVLKVSARSNPNSVAGAIAGVVREQGSVAVQVVGAGALNQAIKAIAIARSFLQDDGLDVVCIPTFRDIEIGGESRTAIRLIIESRTERGALPEPESEPAMQAARRGRPQGAAPPTDGDARG